MSEYKTLERYQQGKTLAFEDDGHIGIPYKITVYYDYRTCGAAKAGCMTQGATPVILYVIGAVVERIGTDEDETIIKGMLSRGYAVAVLDYLGDARAKSPALDTSAQLLRTRLSKGEFFTERNVFPLGEYKDSAIVPAGYDILMNSVYFSLDRHGTHGTLEKIVNVWNNDFRKYRKGETVKWIHADGTRKSVQPGFDGSAPVWYADREGEILDMERGEYTRLEYTDAKRITDCVRRDGSPIDLDLYLHVTYPTHPKKSVPVMAMFSSTGMASTGNANPTRPQFAGFLFGGYAGAVFDYAWIPMGREDHYGYFDGSGGEEKSVTGDNMSYATYTYNATQTVTAAIRYLRYLALSEPDRYRFDIERIGSFGISKASWATQLGAPTLRQGLLTPADGRSEEEIRMHVNKKINSFVQMYYLDGCDGSTRYDVGMTEDETVDGFTVRGGELQPWAVWNGFEISSGVQMLYSCCGGFIDYLCKEYTPMFITENLQDTFHTEYGQQNIFVNLCRNMDIPSLWFEADIAHTFAIGNDARYGVDIYRALFRFADYYLKNGAPCVAYTVPADGTCISPTQELVVKMIGEISREQISRITVVDGNGRSVRGLWRSAYGDTEWHFTPYAMEGSETYVLTIPADMTAKNGVALGTERKIRFWTTDEKLLSTLAQKLCVSKTGKVVSFDPFVLSSGRCVLRIRVENDAANLLMVSDAKTEEWIGSVRVSGVGYYEIDLTEYASKISGDHLSIRLTTERAAGSVTSYKAYMDQGNGGFLPTKDTVFFEGSLVDGVSALAVIRKPNKGKYKGGHVFYHNMEGALTMTHETLIDGGRLLTRKDLGRRFLIRMRLFDSVSRPIRFWLNNATSRADHRLDFDRVYYTYTTHQKEWREYTVPYTVYESKYGVEEQSKVLYVQFTPTGSTEAPVFVEGVDVEEVFTDVAVSEISLVRIP